MNYLAHALLSFNNPEILSGNMIRDFVKGKKQYQYPVTIQKGIHLHRLIDDFTDHHPVTAMAKEFFRPQYRLYSGAFVDIVYDHFLALDEMQFGHYDGLENFTHHTYKCLEENDTYFPSHFQTMYPYMKVQNWLYNYRLREGICKSFNGLVLRAVYLHESDIAFDIFNTHYKELEDCYANFFPELKSFTFGELNNLMPE